MALCAAVAAGGSSVAGGSGSAVDPGVSVALALAPVFAASAALVGAALVFCDVGGSVTGGPAEILGGPWVGAFVGGALVANVRASASDASTSASVENASERFAFHCEAAGGVGVGLSS